MRAYWAMIAFSTRRKAAAKVIAAAVAGLLAAEWGKLIPNLKAQADRRNELAHGSIGLDKGRPVLAPYYFARVTDER
jgi:hypothetical protein